MARTLTDACVLLGALVGIDSSDNKSLESFGHFESDYTKFLNENGLIGKKDRVFKI